jgi:hypothetical protein
MGMRRSLGYLLITEKQNWLRARIYFNVKNTNQKTLRGFLKILFLRHTCTGEGGPAYSSSTAVSLLHDQRSYISVHR